ncbi:2926_t:CDS:2 [Ambispora leptoticha]|uniref:2926_t:CDS:1 n=1 Tax=Ambispora leptoticha TaxID=144679 RepID=A0A9N9C155_9GLOM|nr:2926_t:CDS:2 [Ambispora leptoticha]
MATNIMLDDFYFLLCTRYNDKDILLVPIVRYPNIPSQLDF